MSLIKKYPHYCLYFYLFVWVLLAVKPLNRFDWFLENLLPFIFVSILLFAYKKFKFSNLSYTLITVFMILHAIGAHYTYSEVPFIKSLFNVLHFERDHYDRLVHFTFGLLMVYPLREFLIKFSGIKKSWSYIIPINIIMSASAAYEIIEWIVAVIVQPDNAIAWLGIQGDVFDVEKDMLIAAIGAVIAITIIHFRNKITKIFNLLLKIFQKLNNKKRCSQK